ncbi:MAG: Ni/Fe hydrogenase subunit alpha, partial [Kiritimatiellae bacterium]|nr:Ni/Fe hydrogenase subunit alpha [Kiritimatiellia bacterium]
DADPTVRNIIGVAQKHPQLAVQGVMLRKYGQEIIRATAGKKIHGTGAIPGGINKNLSVAERDTFLKDINQILDWSRAALALARDYTVEHFESLAEFGSFESNHLSLVRADGALDLYHGGLRAIDPTGRKIFDHVDYQRYADYIAEEVKPWSYMKFPFIRSLGCDAGWYRVGPLARLNTCDFIDTPLAEAARREFVSFSGGKTKNVTMAYHWARMIELLHAAEKIADLLHDPDLQGTDLMVSGKRRSEAVGLIEAPRGTLFHHYQVDDNGLVMRCNLIVSTTNNNMPMNRAVEKVARDYLEGTQITEGLLNRIEVAIRAYDPCLSCATHALGQMPLILELYDHRGQLLDRRVKGV